MVKSLALMLPLLAGCGSCFYQQLVYVTDDEGKPVEGAKVWVAYASFDARPSLTNAAGIAPVSMGSLFTVYGVQASAEGMSAEVAGRPSRWPVEITLRRESTGYEFIGAVARQGQLSEVESALDVGDLDPRWFIEFELKQVIRGTPPSVLRYAVHSPTLFLPGVPGDVRVIREFIEFKGRKIPRVRVLPLK